MTEKLTFISKDSIVVAIRYRLDGSGVNFDIAAAADYPSYDYDIESYVPGNYFSIVDSDGNTVNTFDEGLLLVGGRVLFSLNNEISYTIKFEGNTFFMDEFDDLYSIINTEVIFSAQSMLEISKLS